MKMLLASDTQTANFCFSVCVDRLNMLHKYGFQDESSWPELESLSTQWIARVCINGIINGCDTNRTSRPMRYSVIAERD